MGYDETLDMAYFEPTNHLHRHIAKRVASYLYAPNHQYPEARQQHARRLPAVHGIGKIGHELSQLPEMRGNDQRCSCLSPLWPNANT